MDSVEDAMTAYEYALRANPQSTTAMHGISLILRTREEWRKAIDYLQAILKIEPNNGEAYASLGHCYLMLEDLQQAYASYQTALIHLPNAKVCLQCC